MRSLTLGQRSSARRTFNRDDLEAYRRLSGSDISMESDRVPEPLLAGMFSYLLGTHLPGRGANYLKQSLRFERGAEIGEELTAEVEIVRLRPEKQLVNLRTVCRDAAGNVICEGEALVLVRDLEG